MLSSVQIIAARILLEITAAELAELAKVHESTIWRVEKNGWDVAPGNVPTLERILNAFEKRGVEFIDGGVRPNIPTSKSFFRGFWVFQRGLKRSEGLGINAQHPQKIELLVGFLGILAVGSKA